MPYASACDVAANVYLLANEPTALAQGYLCAGGSALALYFVSDAELAAGTFVLEGDPKATPIYPAPEGSRIEGGPALPVYLVNQLV